MKTTGKSPRKEQVLYKLHFDAILRNQKYDISEGSYIFLRNEKGTVGAQNQKLARIATGPCQVTKSDANTAFIVIGYQEERLLRDRVELTASPMDYTSMAGLLSTLQSLEETFETNEDDPVETGGVRTGISEPKVEDINQQNRQFVTLTARSGRTSRRLL